MLPRNLKYGSKVESAPARSVRSNIAPQNGTAGYNLGDIININIPTRANLVMVPTECYLKFDIAVKKIYSGSNLLEDIDNYGLLAKMLFDLQVPTDAAYGKYNVMCGTRNDLVVQNSGGVIPGDGTGTAANIDKAIGGKLLSAIQVNSGELLAGNVTNNASTPTYTYNLNLISVLGCLCNSQYFPLFACTSAPLRMEIQLVDSLQKAMLVSATGGSITVSNMEYIANFIELSDVAMSMISQSLEGQPLQFVVPQYRNYAWSGASLTNGTATQISMPIPAKFSSLKSLFVTSRDKSTGTALYFPFSSVTAGIDNYYFRVGPNVYPPKAPNRVTEMFCETLKAMGSIADLNYQPSIEKTSYSTLNSAATVAVADIATDPQANSAQSGSFYIGLDLENYCSAPKDSIFAGYNSNTDDIFCNIAYNGTGATSNTMRWDCFASFDCVYVFENNTCFIRF